MEKLKIITILGARPQFIKAAAVSNKFKTHFNQILVHTGQHYDLNMSDVFFEELEIPKPKYHLNVGSGSHGLMTGTMLIEIEKVLLEEKPDFVMVYGDTNSTLAGSLAASKLHIPVIHTEAGLRSFNMKMAEEQNRILTDHISSIRFVPTKTGVHNLMHEGIVDGVHLVGDVMYDGILHFAEVAVSKSKILNQLNLKKGSYVLCTIHRAENTDDSVRLKSIVSALNNCSERVVLPIHPRTRMAISKYGIELSDNIFCIDPVGYLDMVSLETSAKKIVTDSGGIQKEAFFLGVPCITLREETEWVETVENGWNILVGSSEDKITEAIKTFYPTQERRDYFGSGDAVDRMVDFILSYRQCS